MTAAASALERELYLKMATIRRVEETILDLFRQGRLRGTTHASIGQEACAVGVVGALDPARDFVFSNHRCHGHFLAWGGEARALFAELFGRETGVCAGLGGSQHLCWRGFYSNGVQGGIVPVAVGLALARKAAGEGGIGAVFLGDGTFGEGAVYEGMNLAALWGAPLLFVVEDNGYAQSTPRGLQHAGRLAARPAAFGIDTVVHEVRDPVAVRQLAAALVAAVRADARPRCLYLHTYRLAPHSLGEDFRDPGEIEAHRRRDPLLLLRRRLPPGEADAIDAAVAQRVAEALALAEADPPTRRPPAGAEAPPTAARDRRAAATVAQAGGA
jgi:TPP-dependent pyruvate/acetoin dehydrogenase alpha subunit